MSLSSLQDRMEQRAASMAQMAKRASNPQDIQAMQQRLTTEIQNGTIKPYIGIPLIQELTKRLGEAKAKAAMNVMGAQAPAQGGAPAAPAAPIAQQVMQQAAQEGQGVEALPSNLPQSYAGGGIIAFAGGGEAEEPLRFQNEGVVPSAVKYKDWGSLAPVDDSKGGPFFSGDVGAKIGTAFKNAILPPSASELRIDPITQKPITYGEFLRSQERERTGAAPLAGSTPVLDSRGATFSGMQGKTSLPTTFAPSPPPVNAGGGNAPPITSAGPAAAPNAGIAGIGMPTPPALVDYTSFFKELPDKVKKASEEAITSAKNELKGINDPLNKAEEETIAKREGRIAQDSKVAGLMALARAGLKTAAGTSRNALQNIATGLEGGLDDLIKAEAAKRAATERAEDARMNLKRQQAATARGDIATANAAGDRAAKLATDTQQLGLTAQHYGSQAGQQKYATEAQMRGQDITSTTQLKTAEMDRATRLQVAQIQAVHQKQYNELIRQGQLDAKVAQTLLEAEKNFMTAQGMNYVGKPEELARDARTHALNAAKVYLPGVNLGNAPPLSKPTADIYKNKYGITPTQP